MLDIPVIETERLILRGRRKDDFPSYARMWADPVVARFTGGRPLSEEEAWSKFARMEGFWALNGYGFFVVERKEGSGFIGEAGAAEFRRDMTPSLSGMPEFGWGFLPDHHGKGYASEAVLAAIEWARTALAEERYCCIIAPENAASIRVAEKCGFSQAAVGDYRGEPTLVFERPREHAANS